MILAGYDTGNDAGNIHFPGHVGIGVDRSVYTLDVNGDINARDCYYAGQFLFASYNGMGGVNLSNIDSINGSPVQAGVSVGFMIGENTVVFTNGILTSFS